MERYVRSTRHNGFPPTAKLLRKPISFRGETAEERKHDHISICIEINRLYLLMNYSDIMFSRCQSREMVAGNRWGEMLFMTTFVALDIDHNNVNVHKSPSAGELCIRR